MFCFICIDRQRLKNLKTETPFSYVHYLSEMKTKFGELAGQIMKSHPPLTLPTPLSAEKHELKERVTDPLLLFSI